MTDVSGNVLAISTYTIGATGTITIDTFNIFAALAANQVTLDNPGFTTEQSNEAQALYICHLIARRAGQTGKTSVSISKYSYSKTLATGLTSWLDEYYALIARVAAMSPSSTQGIQSLTTDGIRRDDADMNGLGLDQSIPYELEGQDTREALFDRN